MKRKNGLEPTTEPSDIDARIRARIEIILDFQHLTTSEPDFWSRLECFTRNLRLWGARTNLTARPDDADEIAFHIADSLAPLTLANERNSLSSTFEPRRRVLDLGSGAGFPGLILAAATRAQIALLESRRKRASFLADTSLAMRLDNVAILHRSHLAEEERGGFETVTSRGLGVASLGLAAEALAVDGVLIIWLAADQPVPGAAKDLSMQLLEVLPYELPKGAGRAHLRLAVFQKTR